MHSTPTRSAARRSVEARAIHPERGMAVLHHTSPLFAGCGNVNLFRCRPQFQGDIAHCSGIALV